MTSQDPREMVSRLAAALRMPEPDIVVALGSNYRALLAAILDLFPMAFDAVERAHQVEANNARLTRELAEAREVAWAEVKAVIDDTSIWHDTASLIRAIRSLLASDAAPPVPSEPASTDAVRKALLKAAEIAEEHQDHRPRNPYYEPGEAQREVCRDIAEAIRQIALNPTGDA